MEMKKILLRVPVGVKRELEEAAYLARRSVNSEILWRLSRPVGGGVVAIPPDPVRIVGTQSYGAAPEADPLAAPLAESVGAVPFQIPPSPQEFEPAVPRPPETDNGPKPPKFKPDFKGGKR